jgi:outer membrane receptor protein involved in Fe transport
MVLSLPAAPGLAQTAPAASDTELTPQAPTPAPRLPDEGATLPDGKDVIVTGSRIRSSDTTTPAPVTIISPQVIDDRGFVQIGDALNELPSITPSFARNTGIGSPVANTQDAPNLFNLGQGRTLSLVNGRRTATTSPGLDDPSVDSNIIPIGLLERVDVVQAGGAAVYGSGAMAGVVNYVLKKNFQGLTVDTQYSITSRGDYPIFSVRGTYGTNFAGGKGNVAVDIEYSKSQPLAFTDRPLSAKASYPGTNPANKTNSDGIPSTIYFDYTKTWSSSYNGLLWGNGTGTGVSSLLNVGGHPVQFNDAGTALIPYNPGTVVFSNLAVGGDGVPYNSKSSLYAGIERFVTNIVGHYDLTPNITISTELLYAHTLSDDPLARLRTVQYDNTGSVAGGTFSFAVYKDNAYLTPTEVAQLSAASPTFAAGGPLYLGKFAANILPDTDLTTDTKTYRGLVSVDGNFSKFDRDFNWSVSFSKAEVDTEYSGWALDQSRLRNAADAVLNGAGQPVCRINAVTVTDPNCVPINLFGSNNISDAARNYVAVQSGRNQSSLSTPYTNDQSDLLASIGGDVIKVPAGTAKFNITYEHRAESAETDPLEADQLGLVGAQTPSPPVSGSYHTNEFAGELLIPLLGDDFTLPLVKKLELNGSYRIVDDSLAGKESVWGTGLRWDVFNGLTLRSSLSRNFRAPTIDELLQPATLSAAVVTNPCSNTSIVSGSNPAARQANCLALFQANPGYGAIAGDPGATAAQRLAGFYDYGNAFARVLVTTGGNPALKNEISHTFTYGVVLQPRFIPGLTITADRIQLSLRNALSQFTASQFLSTCFDSTSQPAGICSTFTYNPDGTLATAQATTFNAGYLKYHGEIYDINYHFGLASIFGGQGDLGTIALSLQATHNALRITSVTGLDLTEIDDTTQLPSWVFHPEVHYSIGRLRVNYSMFYLPAEKMNYTDNVENQSVLPVAANVRHNISFDYTVDRLTMRFGINNFTDEAPSYPYSANYGDIIGRQFFVGIKAKI